MKGVLSTGPRLAWAGYLLLAGLAAGLKIHYRHAGSDDLLWILAPTARLTGWFSDLRFVYEAHTGFVDPLRHAIIAPGCAGVNFMVVALCMAGFSGLGGCRTLREHLFWLISGAAGAYVLTIAANAIRIVAAVHLYHADIYGGWVTPARVHRMAGIMVYIFMLCAYHRLVTALKNAADRGVRASGRRRHCGTPLMWYAAVTVGVPLLNRAYRNGADRFAEHCATVAAGCVIAFSAGYLVHYVAAGVLRTVKRRRRARDLAGGP